MGAWGHETFEDDSALDLLAEWMELRDPLPQVQSAIERALASDYLDYEHGQTICVASALVDALDHPPKDPPEGLLEWVQGQDRAWLLALAPSLVEGISRLVGDESELAELWIENEELFPKWQEELNARQARLRTVS